MVLVYQLYEWSTTREHREEVSFGKNKNPDTNIAMASDNIHSSVYFIWKLFINLPNTRNLLQVTYPYPERS